MTPPVEAPLAGIRARILLLLLLLVLAAPPALAGEWAQSYGGGGSEVASCIVPTPDLGFLVAGSTNSFGAGSQDFWVLKLDADGIVTWEKTYGDLGNDIASVALATSDGGYLVGGSTDSSGAGGQDFWVLKLDATGAVQWQNTYGGPLEETLNGAAEVPSGGYVLAGTTTSFGTGADEAWVVLLDAMGGIVWENTYGGLFDDRAIAVQAVGGGGFLVVADTNSYGVGDLDIWILRLSPLGDVQWQEVYGGAGWDRATAVIEPTPGGFLVAGSTRSWGAGFDDMLLLKVDGATGALEWKDTYGGADSDVAWSVAELPGGDFALAGWTASFGTGAFLYWVVRVDASGVPQWGKTCGGTGGDVAYSVRALASGGLAVAGESQSVGGIGASDLWVLKTDPNGAVGPSCPFLQDASPTVAFDTPTMSSTSVLPSPTMAGVAPTAVAGVDTFATVVTQCSSAGCTQINPPALQTMDGLICGGAISTTDSTPALVWSNVANETGYEWEVYAGSGCVGTLVASGTTAANATSVDVSPALSPGAYSWRVRATGDGTAWCTSAWTCGCDFLVVSCPTLTAPSLTTVDGQACGGTITTLDTTPPLVWADVANETGYQWEVWSGAGCTGTRVANGATAAGATTADATPALPAGTYSWRVRAMGDGTTWCNSAWTCGCSFTVQACTALSPPALATVDANTCGGAIQTTDTTPALTWSNVSNETGYEWEVWNGANCSGTRVANGATAADTTSADVSPALANGTYSWRVRATGDGTSWCTSAWTCGCSFTVAACGTISPPVLATVDAKNCGGTISTGDPTPSLTWSDVSNETGYEWEVYAGAACTGTAVASGTTAADSALATVSPALANGTYTWRVRATGNGTTWCTSLWTCDCPFTVAVVLMLCGDIAPRGAPDGFLDVGDAVVALRFAAGLDTPTVAEILAGDVAPGIEDPSTTPPTFRPNPDGVIDVGDAVVLLRASAGLIQIDCGP